MAMLYSPTAPDILNLVQFLFIANAQRGYDAQFTLQPIRDIGLTIVNSNAILPMFTQAALSNG